MKQHFYFGETVPGYDILVLNEREARAGAGILLLPAMFSFLNSYLTHNFIFTKIFVTVFMIDFFIRIFINPKYAPSLILGRIFIQNQTPEYVGAKQKRFAWSIGFILSIVMFFIIVVFEFMTTIKIAICLLCIVFLFSETAFGICIGCIVYHRTQKNTPMYCPGNVCEVKPKEKIQQFTKGQFTVLLLFFIGIFAISNVMMSNDNLSNDSYIITKMKCEAGKCGGNM